MYNISFLIPESEIIPTRLRLNVEKEDGKDITVNYRRIEGSGLVWEFDLYNITCETEASDIVEQICRSMINQSYDHGQEWRLEGIEFTRCEINYAIQSATLVATFRIKDSY